MITLIDKSGSVVAINTTGKHSLADCRKILNDMNEMMEDLGLGRVYIEAVNEKGDKIQTVWV